MGKRGKHALSYRERDLLQLTCLEMPSHYPILIFFSHLKDQWKWEDFSQLTEWLIDPLCSSRTENFFKAEISFPVESRSWHSFKNRARPAGSTGSTED